MALLDGLLHCYTPSLGPTGYRLIDRGPRRIHGVAGAGITSGAWRGNANRWCLRGANAANEQFDGCGTFPAGDRTVIIWWRAQVALPAFTDIRFAFSAGVAATGQAFQIGLFNGAAGTTGAVVTQNGDSINIAIANDNAWHCVAATNTGTSWQLIVDGVLAGSKTMTTTQNTTAPTILGGTGFFWNGDIGETAWWNRILTLSEFREVFRRGDGAIGRSLTGQAYRDSRLSQAIAAGGATPWLYARRRSQIIGAGGVH